LDKRYIKMTKHTSILFRQRFAFYIYCSSRCQVNTAMRCKTICGTRSTTKPKSIILYCPPMSKRLWTLGLSRWVTTTYL
jgi:hypothetical protein